ncbi:MULTISPECIES: hypothetical protein [unclassified Pseudonocardia]|uniref:hypothetical protein n=1 Tax=unclassified Pseudonocardia TaxID=2619320 RepID=UPI0002E7CC07|nr:hypothetical protein [Pseudonocardia sp. Ae707_Ps1]OLM16740.1 hypothetical protein Ae707Ps1_0998 [Pseudonocardia sp. Ae707_Ps1]
MPPNILPSPPDFAAGPVASWSFFFIAGALAVFIALPWAVTRLVKHRDTLPILIVGSGFLCSLLEPMLDLLGHLRWANDLPVAFTNFGIDIPWLIPFCYAAFLGLESYFIYVVFKHGVTVRQIMLMVFPIAIMTDAVMETIGLNLGVYEYYGYQPYSFLLFPYWWGFINAASFVTVALLIWYLEPLLKGWNRLAMLLVAPTGMMIAYFSAGWPHLLAHNSTLPEWARFIFATITMVMCVGVVRVVAHFVAVPEPQVDWTVGTYLKSRFMLPGARQRLVERLAEQRAVRDAEQAQVGHPTPSGTSGERVASVDSH